MPRKFIMIWLQESERALREKKIRLHSQVELTVVFLDKSPAKKINWQYRLKNYATDVLSFEGDGKFNLGELVLCPDIIAKQAKDHDLSFQQELGYMLLHGILHLLGYDHENSESEAKRMFLIQDEVFDKLCRKFWK
jgi:probable rRNA maturation factor